MRALGVRTEHQASGIGTALVAALEAQLRRQRARLLLVDTSGTDAFRAARGFYVARGYTHAATISDFWADGDDKLSFVKRLA
jgi:ribosomal protein S18 acetylase RimI-like enzyme